MAFKLSCDVSIIIYPALCKAPTLLLKNAQLCVMAVLSLKSVMTKTHTIAVTSYVQTDKFSTVQTNQQSWHSPNRPVMSQAGVEADILTVLFDNCLGS